MDDSIASGITFGSFDVQGLLGQGSFGKVFKVNRKGVHNPERNALALKV